MNNFVFYPVWHVTVFLSVCVYPAWHVTVFVSVLFYPVWHVTVFESVFGYPVWYVTVFESVVVYHGTHDCSLRCRHMTGPHDWITWLLYKMHIYMTGSHDYSIRCTDIWLDHMTAL